MTNAIKVEMGFVQRRLPWILGGGMLLIFLITLSRWLTRATAQALAAVAGWEWQPDVLEPLHVLLTWPVRWLPGAVQLPALNLFEAVCAALALALLARSVALLPHDRTKEQRQFERSDYSLLSIRSAWMPPVLAALVCGLQLNFWENAVASNGDMLDLLLFAYLVRCLLEFRLDHNEGWLTKLAFVYGLSVANNYAMVAFFPAFLVALVWIKWATFFNWRFAGRMLLWGVLGLLLYLVMPLLASLKPSADYSFLEVLRSYLGFQRTMLVNSQRYLLVFLSLTSLLPVLFIGIRWPASFGDTSPTGQALTNLTTHVIHLIFLGACLYVTFDLEFSPRRILYATTAALPFYYLGALSIGYFAGYVLLVFGEKPDPNAKSWQRPSLVRQIAGKALVALVWVAFIAVPAALAWKNHPILHARNSPALSRHAVLMADSLPAQPAVVLADDATRLYALEAELRRRTPDPGHILVESVSLANPNYHRFLHRRYGQRLPFLVTNSLPADQFVDASRVIAMLFEVSRSPGLYYLHPSYGYFFESFYLRPHQAVYQMVPFTNLVVSPPPLTEAECKAQDEYWDKVWSVDLAPLIQPAPAPVKKQRKGEPLFESEGGVGEMRMVYSRALNHFGFEVQRAGDLKMAGEYFDRALQINKGNLYAYISKDYNTRLLAGRSESIPPSTNILEQVERAEPYPLSLDDRLRLYGPPAEPSVCELMAQQSHATALYRQSAQWLERSLAFDPTNINRRLFFISESLHLGMADHVLDLIAELRARPPVPLTTEDRIDLTRAEAWARFSKGDLPAAERLLRTTQQQFPKESSPFTTLAEIYLASGNQTNPVPVTNIVALYETQLKLQPNNAGTFVRLATLLISAGQHSNALPHLDRAINLNPEDANAIFYRGLCHLHLAQLNKGNLDAARVDVALADFLQVTSRAPKSYSAFWGVAECYRLKRNKNEALRYYRKFLESAPLNHPDRGLAERRIKQLKSGDF